MTNGKIALGVAAAIVTVGTGLAFKASKHPLKRVYGFTLNNTLKQCASLWTESTGGIAVQCNTKAGGAGATLYGSGTNHHTWFTSSNGASKVTKVTTTN